MTGEVAQGITRHMYESVRAPLGEAASYDAYYRKRFLYWSFNVVGKARSFRRLCHAYGVRMSGARVLDVGFGAGAMLLQFDRSCSVAGLEFSHGAIKRVQHEAERRRGSAPVDLRLWDAESLSLPFSSQAFDVVIMSHILEHVPSDRALLAEARRVLGPSGRLVVMVPIDDPSWTDNQDHVRKYDEASLRRAVEAEGISVIGTRLDLSVENVLHQVSSIRWLTAIPFIRSRLLGALSLSCTLAPGIERLSVFGPPRNLGLVGMPRPAR